MTTQTMSPDELNPLDQKILHTMTEDRGDGPWGYITPKMAAEKHDTSRQYVQNRLQILRAGGFVVNTGYGVYEITDAGVDAVGETETWG